MSCSAISRVCAALLLAAAASQAPVVAQTYDEASRQLFLPFVQVGNTLSSNVQVRLDNFVVLTSSATTEQAATNQSPGQTVSYDGANRQLFMPFVQVANLFYSNVLLRLDNFEVLSNAPPLPLVPIVAPVCTGVNFTLPRYEAIAVSMTFEQVRRLIGCNATTNFSISGVDGVRRISWQEIGSTKDIVVFFDANSLTVLADGNPGGRNAMKSKNIL